LNNNFSIGATGEFDIAKVLILDGGVVGDDAVVHQVDLMGLVEMRMGVSVYFLPACRPTGMSDAASGYSCLLHDLLHNFVYAASLFQPMFSVFDQSTSLYRWRIGEDPGTIISSILE
jgi:hypothetical protein